MSQVSSSWDAMCTVLLNNRDQFQLSADPMDDELTSIVKVYENGFVQKLVSDWISKLARVSSDEQGISLDPVNLGTNVEPQLIDQRNVTEERVSQNKGRFVVATEDLAESATIIHERAFVLAPVYDETYKPGKSRPFCSHCLSALTLSEHTCAKCKRVSYCSESCLVASDMANIHQFQCKGHLMGLFHDLGVSHLAVNAMLAGIESISDVVCDTEDGQVWTRLLVTANDVGRNDYANVLRLGTNFSHTGADDYLRFALTATMFTFYLRDYTDFRFVQSEHIVAALLLRHIGQIVNNAHTIYGISMSDPSTNVKLGELHDRLRVDVIGTGLFPRIAILNHSCDPNIRNHFRRNELTIYATRPIGRHDEVFNGYCPGYKLLDGAKRRQLLQEQYGFDCDCSKCDQNSESDLLQQFQTYICQTVGCHRTIVPDAKQSKWWREGDQPVQPLVCAKCQVSLDMGWSDQFMSLFERDVESVQQLKWLAQDTCDSYADGCRRFAAHHLQKWDMASMVLKLLPIGQIEFDENDGLLLVALTKVAADYVDGVAQQFGSQSLEYIEASAYSLDMLARQKAAIGRIDKTDTDNLQATRALIKDGVSDDVWPIYEQYFTDFLL